MFRLFVVGIIIMAVSVAMADSFGISLNETVNIAVLDFDPKGVTADASYILTDKLRAAFVSGQRYTVLERNKMDVILREQGFQQSGCTDEACVIKAGQVLGVQKMIAGNIGRLGQIFTLSARIIDLQKGVIEKTAQVTVQGAIENVLLQGIPDLYRKLTNETSGTQANDSTQSDTSDQVLKVEYQKGWPARYSLDNTPFVNLINEESARKNYSYYIKYPAQDDLTYENIKQFESLFNIDKVASFDIKAAHEIIKTRNKHNLVYAEIAILAVGGIVYSFNPKAQYKGLTGFSHPLLYLSTAIGAWGTWEFTIGSKKRMEKAQKKIMHAIEVYNQSRS